MKTIHYPFKRCQLPDMHNWDQHYDGIAADHAVRWVARRYRVSLAMAETIVSNAGIGRRHG
jgi:hypothetical protein